MLYFPLKPVHSLTMDHCVLAKISWTLASKSASSLSGSCRSKPISTCSTVIPSTRGCLLRRLVAPPRCQVTLVGTWEGLTTRTLEDGWEAFTSMLTGGSTTSRGFCFSSSPWSSGSREGWAAAVSAQDFQTRLMCKDLWLTSSRSNGDMPMPNET